MSKPILIPSDKTRFLHAHLGKVSIEPEDDKQPVSIQYCESFRPQLDFYPDSKSLFGNMPIQAWTPCGQEIYWRLK